MSDIYTKKGGRIPQLDADPVAPAAEDAWVLKTGGTPTGGGEYTGFLMGITTPGTGGAATYELSYRTKESTTVRVPLT